MIASAATDGRLDSRIYQRSSSSCRVAAAAEDTHWFVVDGSASNVHRMRNM